MLKVKNIEFENLPFIKNNKNFQKCIEYIKLVDPDYKKYLPESDKQKLSFELHNTNVDLANTLRRFMIDEIPIQSMDVDMECIKTDDKFILPDYFKKNIELIPINQEIDYTKIKISLEVNNSSDTIMVIYSSDLNITDLNGKKLKNGIYFRKTIIIYHLRPMCFVNIKQINIVSGIGRHNSGKFIPVSNIGYEILDVKPVTHSKYVTKGKSSLNSNPTQFRISATTHGNMDIKKFIIKCCESIIYKFSNINKELDEVKDDDVYFSPSINIETKEDIKIFHFIGEYWTISNIMSRYCYLIDTDITFVCTSIVHPSIEESMVKIKHPQPRKLLMSAIKKIIADFTIIKSTKF
jgi:DNA-directed RNA polymerase subunit L